MNLFKDKKKDYKRDPLRLEFELENKQYVYYYGKQKLTLEEMSRRTRKNLENENEKLRENQELLDREIEMAKLAKRFEYLKARRIVPGFESYSQEEQSMSKDMEAFLVNLTTKENVIIGIHRTGFASMDGIQDMLENGIIMSGASAYGVSVTSNIDINRNISFYLDNKTIIKELMLADTYKNSKGSILIEIPEEDLGKDLYITDERGVPRLNPKYIIGFVPIEGKHHISRVITAEQISKRIQNQEEALSSSDVEVTIEEPLYDDQENLPKRR